MGRVTHLGHLANFCGTRQRSKITKNPPVFNDEVTIMTERQMLSSTINKDFIQHPIESSFHIGSELLKVT